MHRIACLLVAGLTLAFPLALSAQEPGRSAAADVDILIEGVPQREYFHQGRLYVEAVQGREYAIRLRNPYGVRVAVALSVDGLNTIDARHTTATAARKWVLGPYETVTISGWQTSRTDARRFEFTTEARSYAQALGQASNLGVISAVFFRERVAAVAPEVSGGRSSSKDTSRGRARNEDGAAPSAPAPPSAAPVEEARQSVDEQYAATGMGRRTDHAVTEVWLDLEDRPARSISIRYEFRPQLVRLGVLPPAAANNALQRRQRARGFEPGFSPEPPR
jgi:hypothetical protein